MTINMNDNVSVKLTEHGANILNQDAVYWEKRVPNHNLKSDYKNGDIYKTQLWYLFELFREYISMCKPNCFDLNIEIND